MSVFTSFGVLGVVASGCCLGAEALGIKFIWGSGVGKAFDGWESRGGKMELYDSQMHVQR